MNKLSSNYRQYVKLQSAIRSNSEKENVGMLLQEIQEPGHAMTEFEKEYAAWTTTLWEKLDIDAIKAEIKRLSKTLREGKELGYRTDPYDKDVVRVTKLCALRAAMRGKLHFSDTTDINLAIWCKRIPVSNRSFNNTTTRWEGVVDLKAQKEWVQDVAEEFMK